MNNPSYTLLLNQTLPAQNDTLVNDVPRLLLIYCYIVNCNHVTIETLLQVVNNIMVVCREWGLKEVTKKLEQASELENLGTLNQHALGSNFTLGLNHISEPKQT